MANNATTTPTGTVQPRRGEVWRVQLDPTRGDEIQKTRPSIVISPTGLGRPALRVIVPVIGWKEHFRAAAWMIELVPDGVNGFSKHSAADCFQLRAVDLSRFVEKLGEVATDDLDTITAAAVLCVGYTPE